MATLYLNNCVALNGMDKMLEQMCFNVYNMMIQTIGLGTFVPYSYVSTVIHYGTQLVHYDKKIYLSDVSYTHRHSFIV